MELIKRILNIGVQPGDEADLIRKKQINNQVGCYTVLATLLFFPYFLLVKNYFFIPVLCIGVLLLIISFVFNSKSRLALSQLWRFAVVLLLVFFASIEMTACGFEFFLIPQSLVPIILSENLKVKITLFLISLGVFLMSKPVSFAYFPHFNTNPQITFISYTLVLTMVFILCALFVFKFKELSGKYEKVINKQLLEIEEKNNDILDSINYAKGLQRAILPPVEFMQRFIPEHFLFYSPKDIVAGDFYWMETEEFVDQNNKKELIFIAAADCTGHGVPGAMVSMICSNALSRAVKEFKIYDTGKILDKVRTLVLETFEKSVVDVHDGMDISLMAIDRKNNTIQWSGANNSLFYGKDDLFAEVKPNKQPIGRCDNPIPFISQNISYQKGTNFYLFTDGFADQFGGPHGKKFRRKQFFELLQANSHIAAKDQYQPIKNSFENWKGELSQMDDVCVLGIKL